MKEMYIDMVNSGWEGDPNDYLKMRVREEEVKKSEIICPNCMVDMLIQESKEDLSCVECGYEFVLIGYNTVRFK